MKLNEAVAVASVSLLERTETLTVVEGGESNETLYDPVPPSSKYKRLGVARMLTADAEAAQYSKAKTRGRIFSASASAGNFRCFAGQ